MTRRQITPAELTVTIAHGTYTPTLTNGTNVAASTASVCQYSRVGNTVTVSGNVQIDATATGTASLRMEIPIASNFTALTQLGGAAGNAVGDNAAITGTIATDDATFTILVSDVANRNWGFVFAYLVL